MSKTLINSLIQEDTVPNTIDLEWEKKLATYVVNLKQIQLFINFINKLTKLNLG